MIILGRFSCPVIFRLANLVVFEITANMTDVFDHTQWEKDCFFEYFHTDKSQFVITSTPPESIFRGNVVHLIFRWFTLKPPYSGAHERSLLAIWDTSHWNFFVKFGLRTACDISYDILLSLLKFVNFWRLHGRLSILAKIGCLQKIKVFSMKQRWGFDATGGGGGFR